jgi:hypothetical protein
VPSIASRVDRLAAHRYAFLSDWELAVDLPAAFAVLKDLWSYPRWWPEFKRAEQIADDEGIFALCSVLPLTLNFTLRRDVEDEASGLLRALASGDITGSVEWRLEQNEPRLTTAHFVQRVTLDHRLARRTDFVLRPVLMWNHDAAMRSGHRGIQAYLTKS